MNGEIQPLVTNEPVKVQGFEKINDQLRKIYGIYSNFFLKNNQKITTYNRLDLGTLGSRLIMPNNLLGH